MLESSFNQLKDKKLHALNKVIQDDENNQYNLFFYSTLS